jgi:streptogramin lyase
MIGGTLIITEQGLGSIGQFEPNKDTIKEWLIPTSGSEPWHEVRYRQFIYFTEALGNKIGRLNLHNNVITEWNLPSTNAVPVGIDISSDGRYLWFLEETGNKVAVLDTMDNEITEWPDPTGILIVHIKVSGSVAFFADQGQNSQMIGEIDPSTNTLNIWNTPTANSQPGDLVVFQQEQGYLVKFTEFTGNNVAVLDTSKQAPSSTTTVTPVETMETPASTTVTPTVRTLSKTVTKVQPNVTQNVNPVVTGGFAEWAVPMTDSGPGGIDDVDGITLFTERAGNKVGVLVP